MVDDLRSDDGLGGFDGHHHRPARRPEKERPLADREVPLGHQEQDARVLAPAVHAWLDGELPEASVRKGDTARDVEFWKNINVEVERRRRMQTPVYLEARIMEALPQTAPAGHHAVVASRVRRHARHGGRRGCSARRGRRRGHRCRRSRVMR